MALEIITTDELLDDLTVVVDVARRNVTDPRWLSAIEKAWNYLLENDELVYDRVTAELVYYSESGKIYRANGSCQCKAYQAGQACKHRAAARLVLNALERQQVRADVEELYV